MHSLYEDGIALLNYEGLDPTNFHNMRYAIPFWSKVVLPNEGDSQDDLTRTLDELLAYPSNIHNSYYNCRLWDYCNYKKPIGYRAVIRKIKCSCLKEMIDDLLYHTSKLVGKYLDTKKIWNIENMVYVNRKGDRVQQKEYIVKIQKANTIRRMFTGFKEVRMMDQVYYSSWGAISGCDVVPQPILGCPVWDGSTWLYVIIMEKVSGVALSKVNSLGYRLWHSKRYNKRKIIDEVAKVVAAFWALGYSHNDLHLGNVIYDINTNKVKIIDLESAVRMPSSNVKRLRKRMSSCIIRIDTCAIQQIINCLVHIYNIYYKTCSISLLYLASVYCQQYQDEDNRIFNTDEQILPMMNDLLKK